MKTTHFILLFLNLMNEKKKKILKQLNVSQKRKKENIIHKLPLMQ